MTKILKKAPFMSFVLHLGYLEKSQAATFDRTSSLQLQSRAKPHTATAELQNLLFHRQKSPGYSRISKTDW